MRWYSKPVLFVKDPVILSSEDRIRMARLYEEVFTRLEEMAMITTRALKVSARADFAVKFNPAERPEGCEFTAVEIVACPDVLGWYDYRAGMCFETEKQAG